jgi:molybdenum cofactor synthesis domain-containing protein
MSNSSVLNPTAALLIIGNEILSGRTADKNLNWLAKELSSMGIRLSEARVVADIPEEIVSAVNTLRTKYTYLFTTGGIGPTHDDITTECVAAAFGVKVIRHPEAERLLRAYYAPEMQNEARMRMANTPEGAELVNNPVSVAPGYRIGNVYVMAGVPHIMQSMFGHIRTELTPGAAYYNRSLRVHSGEGNVAILLQQVQDAHPDLDIGSYPFMQNNAYGTSVVARGTNRESIDHAITLLSNGLKAANIEFDEEAAQ